MAAIPVQHTLLVLGMACSYIFYLEILSVNDMSMKMLKKDNAIN